MYDTEEREAIMWQRGALGQDWVAWLGAAPLTVAIGGGSDGLLITHATPKRDDEHVWPDAGDAQLEAITEGVVQRTIAFATCTFRTCGRGGIARSSTSRRPVCPKTATRARIM